MSPRACIHLPRSLNELVRSINMYSKAQVKSMFLPTILLPAGYRFSKRIPLSVAIKSEGETGELNINSNIQVGDTFEPVILTISSGYTISRGAEPMIAQGI